jgi:hypothetical protein
MPTNEQTIRYLLDRVEIQDKIALYGLGQDLHQSDASSKNILEQWNDLFLSDAVIEICDMGIESFQHCDWRTMKTTTSHPASWPHERLDWHPTQPGVISDLDQPGYFKTRKL